MALLSGTFSFSSYLVKGEEPASFRDFIDERMRRFAFQEISLDTEEKAVGWVSLDNLLDTEFANANYSFGDYLAFSMRMDRKSVPAALLKRHVLEAEADARNRSGRKFLSKQERTEIKDRTKISLLSRALPVPTLFDVAWCVSEAWVLFGSLSPKPREEFEKLFKRSFDFDLVPLLPWAPKQVPDELRNAFIAAFPEVLAGAGSAES